MKKFLVCFFSIMLICSLGIVNASSVLDDPEYLQDKDGDGVVYLEDYSQYQGLLNTMDEQYELRKLYLNQIINTADEYEATQRPEVYKAKVIEAGEPEVQYGQYPYYQDYFYKITYQNIKIKLLDEPYKNRVVENVNYTLTCDSYENVKMAEIKNGKNINVVVSENESGDLYAEVASYDVAVRRWPVVLVVIIIAFILMLAYTGEHFAKIFVPFILIADLLIVTIAPMLLDGLNIWWLVAIVVFMTSLAIAVLKFGLTEKTAKSIVASAIMTIMATIIVYAFDSLAFMNGITYEATYIMEYVIPKFVNDEVVPAVDFHGLSVATTTLLCFFAGIFVINKTIDVYEKNKTLKETRTQETVNEVKEYVAENMLLISSILLVTMFPKYLLLLVNKYSFIEVINSEILITDFSRILFMFVTMTISIPVTCLICKFLSDEE